MPEWLTPEFIGAAAAAIAAIIAAVRNISAKKVAKKVVGELAKEVPREVAEAAIIKAADDLARSVSDDKVNKVLRSMDRMGFEHLDPTVFKMRTPEEMAEIRRRKRER